MLAEQHADRLVVRAPAKVNLFLEILSQRADGYHELVTLLVAVDLFDTLEFQEDSSGALELSCDDPSLPAGPDNLAWRAAELLRQPHPLPPLRIGEGVGGEVTPLRSGEGAKERGARIRLTKRIPVAAGLAGGSSDAAATLFGLNRLWRLGFSNVQLAELGAKIGSDVPFFFSPGAAWCTGRGEIVTAAPPNWLDLVLACPPVGLATADVYRQVEVPVAPRSSDPLRRAWASGDKQAIAAEMFNRLQGPAERLCPAVAELRELFDSLKPLGHQMSGSGACYFALCRGPEEAQDFARRVQAQDPRLRVFVTRTLE